MNREATTVPCGRCGNPRRIDAWCDATEECRDFADMAIAAERLARRDRIDWD